MAALFLVAGIALLVIGAAVACLPIFFTGQVVARWEGGLFLGYYYGAYVGYLLRGVRGVSITGRTWGIFFSPRRNATRFPHSARPCGQLSFP
ncbi:hypothetical protein GGP57_002729 [Salinibacter ruber]|nr:hypothetical protein [Salinibacter ruber]MCS3714884.1 hypothetical protein [Salinibacter ruber]